MKYAGTLALSVLIMQVFLNIAMAQDSTAVANSEYKNKVLFLPAIGSSPETGFLFGAVVVPQFKVAAAGPETRSSSVFMSAIYTAKNQILFSILPDIILADEEWTLSGNYFVNYYPESYWGLGAFTVDSDEITALYTEVHLEQNVLRKVGSGLFTGPYFRWSQVSNVSFKDRNKDRISAPNVSGNDGSISAGLGWMTRWDMRNSNMTPTQNHFVQFSLLVDPSWLGSSNSYALYELDARKYLSLNNDGGSVLALQSLLQVNSGNPPFNDLATLGGDRINRGYYSGRYRDQNSAQLQAELRQNIKGRFGFTVFVATGEVWDRFEDFSLRNYKWTSGAGLRFNINKDDPTNIRIDFGISKESTGLYLQFGEAF